MSVFNLPIFLFAGAIPQYMTETVALIVAGAVIAYISFRLKLVPIVGFLLAGVLIGPNALGLVQDQALVDATAEIGVILLLFTIGIEFSLEKLAAIQKLIFGGGTMQVGLSIAATTALLAAFGVDWRIGIFTGMLVALSSTAIVLKLLSESGETNSEPGQIGLGLLDFSGFGNRSDGFARSDARRERRRFISGNRLGVGKSGNYHRTRSARRAARNAEGFGNGRENLFARTFSAVGDCDLFRHGLSDESCRSQPFSGRIFGGFNGFGKPFFTARSERNFAFADFVQRDVFRFGRNAARRAVSRPKSAARCRRDCGGFDYQSFDDRHQRSRSRL